MAGPQPIHDDTRRFILTSIPSVPFLEAVLLVRSAPGQDWDTAAVARRLYLPPARVGELLQALAEAGMARESAPGAWRYSPATPELAQRLDALAAAYAADLVGVSRLIHSRIDKRAQQFADAFRWRKDT
jgi:DNA-binding IclR family transcriptional regulator